MKKLVLVFAAFAMVFLGCIATPEDVQDVQHEVVASKESEKQMPPLIPVGPAVGAPFASINCPDDGASVAALDIRRPVAALLANDALQSSNIVALQNEKVDRVGDTMTGRLTITPSGATGALVANAGPASGQEAIVAAGEGIGGGINATGGNLGYGGRFVAGGGDQFGASCVGDGTGSGIVATGGASAGPGAEIYPGTAQNGTTARMGVYTEGYLRLAGTQINAFVDPGADNALHGGNIPKARGRTFLGGAPPYAFIGVPYGFTSTITVTGLGTTRYTMIRPMADLNYEVHAQIHGAVGYGVAETNIVGRTTTSFELTVFATTTATPGVGAAEYLDILVMGKQ